MDYQYRLLQPNDDYKQALIEKSGITASFTLAEVDALQARNRKTLAEAEANLEMRRAEIINIENFHPFVKDLDGTQLTAAWMYKQSKGEAEKYEEVVASAKAAIEENDKMVADAMGALGLVPAVDPLSNSDENHEQKD